MSTSDAIQALKVPGRLVGILSGQSLDVAAAFPHGGTELGLTSQKRLRRRSKTVLVRAEEFGGTPVAARYRGEEWWLLAALRGWDSDAVSAIAPYTETDDDGKPGLVWSRESNEKWLDDDAIGLLFVPDDTTNHRCVYFPSAIPMWADVVDGGEAEVNLGRGDDDEHLLRVAFLAQRAGTAASGAGVQVRLLADLT